MDVKFPFEYIGKCLFGSIYRPIAKVTLQSFTNNILVDAWMVVDTGADFTILPRHLAQKLRISLKNDCIKDATYGVGGEQTIYLCKRKINAKIGIIQRSIHLAFFDSNEVPALLGRLGALEKFNTEFLKTRAVIFKE